MRPGQALVPGQLRGDRHPNTSHIGVTALLPEGGPGSWRLFWQTGYVTTPSPLLVHDARVALDYGQFSLCGSYGRSGDYMTHLEDALGGVGIAGDDYGVVVCSPHQNNFEMPFRVEVWDRRPPDDRAEWEEIFRCGLEVDEGGLRYQSPTLAEIVFSVPEGSYSLLISGRGFVNRGWPGSTTPGDVWRVQMWPSIDRPVPSRIKIWHLPALD